MRSFRRAATLALVAAVALVIASSAGAWPAIDKTEALIFGDRPLLQPEEIDPAGVGSLDRDACVTAGEPGSTAFDKDISCDDPLPPDNELAIVAHPEDPDILLAGSNDYQLFFNGNTVIQRVPAGYFISFDGGEHWIDGQVPMQASFGAGDPAPAFDIKRNKAIMASLSFVCGQGAPLCSRGNLAVADLDLDKARAEFEKAVAAEAAGKEYNPQLPWHDQMVVNGLAADIAAVQIFSDKEYITVDNNRRIPNGDTPNPNDTKANPNFGNWYLVWARFRSEHFAYDESPIFFTKTENGGAKWTDPVEISGRSLTKCTFQDDPDDTATATGDFNQSGVAETPDDPNACDQDQFAYPVVAPDGTLYVHFHNEQNLQAYELPQRYDSQIMLVKSDDGGDTWYGDTNIAEQAGCVPNPLAAEAAIGACIVPIHIIDLEDSYDNFSQSDDGKKVAIPDYPINVDGRTTLTNQQFRVNSAGTIAVSPREAGPTTAYRLYVVYADNCAGTRPGPGVGVPTDPEVPSVPFTHITDTNLYYAYSDDHGRTWVGGDGPENGRPYNTCSLTAEFPTSGRLIMKPGADTVATGTYPDDQWFPWIDASPATGFTAAATMDGKAHDEFPARETYGYSLWVGGGPTGVPNFEAGGNMSAAASHPRHSRWFRAGARAPSCFDCTRFIGDYNGIAVDINENIHGVWTDMRRPVATVQRSAVTGGACTEETAPEECVPVGLTTEDAYYAQRPVHPGVPVPLPEE